MHKSNHHCSNEWRTPTRHSFYLLFFSLSVALCSLTSSLQETRLLAELSTPTQSAKFKVWKLIMQRGRLKGGQYSSCLLLSVSHRRSGLCLSVTYKPFFFGKQIADVNMSFSFRWENIWLLWVWSRRLAFFSTPGLCFLICEVTNQHGLWGCLQRVGKGIMNLTDVRSAC